MANCVFCDQDNPPGLSNCRLCAAPLPRSEGEPLPEGEFRQELERLLNAGQRVSAIAAYRRRMNVDLTAAMEAIDVLERDHQFDQAPSDPDLEWEVMRRLERGEKIGAIKLYREKTSLGLKEAKDAVEAIEVRMGLGPLPGSRAGCLGVILICGLVLTGVTISRRPPLDSSPPVLGSRAAAVSHSVG